MDRLKEENERWVGDRFIDWFNHEHGTSFSFRGRPSDAPDLVYADGDRLLQVEMVTAYYDEAFAKLKWMHARGQCDAPSRWEGSSIQSRLIDAINTSIASKCSKAYGMGCVLVVCVIPAITSAEQMETGLPQIRVPTGHPFQGIYLFGEFVPPEAPGTTTPRVWQLA